MMDVLKTVLCTIISLTSPSYTHTHTLSLLKGKRQSKVCCSQRKGLIQNPSLAEV